MPKKLARQTTRVGRMPRMKKTGVLVKTSRKGAYNKNRKKNFQKRRAPFVETKTVDDRDTAATFPLSKPNNPGVEYKNYVSELINMNPDSFILKNQGFGESECIGQSIFARYLKMKVSIQFPSPNGIKTDDGQTKQFPLHPQRYELIWGFVPSPLGLTASTTPDSRVETLAHIHDYINNRVDEYFDALTDTMDFVPKRGVAIRIIGRRNIRPPLRQISAPASVLGDTAAAAQQVGTTPTFDTSVSWPMNRKVHYEKSTNLDGGNKETGLYANWSWLPFCCLWNKDYGAIPAASRMYQTPALMWNSQLWFSDS
jgi:hypothetical protein